MSDRAASAALAAALAFCASYAGQRLGGYLAGNPAGVLVTAYVALTWRVAVACFHAGIAALLVGGLAGDGLVRRRWMVWAVVVPAVGIAAWTR